MDDKFCFLGSRLFFNEGDVGLELIMGRILEISELDLRNISN
jgi:hypothetical protein